MAANDARTIDTRQFRNALGRFASGVTVLTAEYENQTHGMTANAFVSVSLDPPLILVSLDNRSNMHRILPAVRRFGISVLAEDQEPLSNHFAGRTVAGLHLRFVTRRDIPLLAGAVAYFVVEVIDIHAAGDHTLYIGRVEHFESGEGNPLLFHAGRYGKIREEKGRPTEWPQDELSLFSIGSVDPPIT
jgi:flavin reductase (DIM6/NTAB) family NADH-FMN oxidoreductase RutF